MAPAAVHDGTAVALTARRAITLDAAFAGPSGALQGTRPEASRAANRSLDQPADKWTLVGRAHTNLMTPGVPKSLTRSAHGNGVTGLLTSVTLIGNYPVMPQPAEVVLAVMPRAK